MSAAVALTLTSSSVAIAASEPAPFNGLAPISGDVTPVSDKVLIAHIEFAGVPDPRPVTLAETRTAIEDGPDSFQKYFLASSSQKYTFTPTFVDWTRVDITPPANCSADFSVMPQVNAAITAAHPEIDLAQFKHVIYVTRSREGGDCGSAAGRSGVPSNAAWVWLSPDFKWNNYYTRTLMHEFLHSLGLQHGSTAVCAKNAAPAPIGPDCTGGSYTDHADEMTGGHVPLSGPRRLALGFTSLKNRKSVSSTASGTYVLNSVDNDNPLSSDAATPDVKTQVLQIPRRNLTSKDQLARPNYYLDFRTQVADPLRFKSARSSLYRGVGIRVGPDLPAGGRSYQETAFQTVNPSVGSGLPAKLDKQDSFANRTNYNLRSTFNRFDEPRSTDASGSDGTDVDTSLKVGQSLWDPADNFTIKLISIDDATGTARVDVRPGAPTGNPTTVSLTEGQLLVTAGSSAINDVIVSRVVNELYIADYGNQVNLSSALTADASQPCRVVDKQTVACLDAKIAAGRIVLGDKDDTTAITASVPSRIGFRLEGGAGNDALEGGPGNDVLDGGTGPNATTGDIDADVMDGGEGNDTVTYANRTTKVTIRPSPQSSYYEENGQWKARERRERLSGAAGENDGITRETENLIGGAGADTIEVQTDTNPPYAIDPTPRRVDGGLGADTIRLGSGADAVLSRDGVADIVVDCGGGSDVDVRVDASIDPRPNCEGGSTGPLTGAQVVITSATPAGTPTALTKATFAFEVPSFATAHTYKCRLQRIGGATAVFAACDARVFSASNLIAGSYTFSVQAYSGTATAGAPATRTFTVNTAAPATPAVTTTTDSNDRTPTISVTPIADATFQCRVGSAAWIGCESLWTLPFQEGSSASIGVRAVSATGVPTVTPATRTITFTAPNPNTTISGGPADASTITTQYPAYSFTATAGTAFTCSLDGGEYQACQSGQAFAKFSNGPHTVRIRVTDTHGNVDPTPAQRTVTVDAPVLAVTAPTKTGLWQNTRTGTYTFAASNTKGAALTYTCLRVYTGSDSDWVNCNPNVAFNFDAASSSTRYAVDWGVRAFNTSGAKVAEFYQQAAILVDDTAPSTRLDAGPANDASISATGAEFTFSTSTPPTQSDCNKNYSGQSCVEFEAKVDNGTWTKVSSPWNTGALAAGEHTIEIRARDLAGNADTSTPIRRTVNVTSNLISVAVSPASGHTWTALRWGMFSFATTNPGGATGLQYRCLLKYTEWRPCTTPEWHFEDRTASGDTQTIYDYAVQILNARGEVVATHYRQAALFYDGVAPDTTVTAGPESGTTVPAAGTSFSFTSPNLPPAGTCDWIYANGASCVSFEAKIDSGNWTTVTSSWNTGALSPGQRTIRIRARDLAGNVDPTEIVRTVNVA